MLQARYCDEECRSADWARHGEYCVLMQQKIRKKKEAKKLRWVSTTQIIGSSHRAYNHGWKTLLAFLVNHMSLSNLLDF